MGEHHRARTWKYLPQVALATLLVVGIPLAALIALRRLGLVEGLLPLLACAVALSFAAAGAGSALWRTIQKSGDIVFSELMVWGFVRRWRADRSLSSAVRLLGLNGRGRADGREMSPERRVRLLERLAAAMDARDPETHGHSRRVARHSAMIAKRLGLGKEEIARIRTAAAIHDVGKVNIPRRILQKPGSLTSEEFELVKRHSEDGARMAAGLEDSTIASIIRHHHERFDGGGYPDGLSGERIPRGARVIAVADTFDAITSARPYRRAKAQRAALDILRSESGHQLEPEAVEAFHEYYSGLRPVAVWGLAAGFVQRAFAVVTGGFGGSAANATRGVTATTLSVLAGGAAIYVAGVAETDSRASAAAGHGSLAPGGGARSVSRSIPSGRHHRHRGSAAPGVSDPRGGIDATTPLPPQSGRGPAGTHPSGSAGLGQGEGHTPPSTGQSGIGGGSQKGGRAAPVEAGVEAEAVSPGGSQPAPDPPKGSPPSAHGNSQADPPASPPPLPEGVPPASPPPTVNAPPATAGASSEGSEMPGGGAER